MTMLKTEPDGSRRLLAAVIAATISMEGVVLAVPGRFGLGKTVAFLVVLFPHVYLLIQLSESSTFSVSFARNFGRTVFWGTIILLLLPLGPYLLPLGIVLFAFKTRGYVILAVLFMLLSNWLMFEFAERITSAGDEPADDQRKTPLVWVFLVVVALLITNIVIASLRG